MFRLESITALDPKEDNFDHIVSLSAAAGVDLIVTSNVSEFEGDVHQAEYGPDTCEYSEVYRYAEVFVRGHDIPWSFKQPIWYAPWQAFHSMNDEFGQWAFALHNSRINSLLTDQESKDVARTLFAQRTSHICYTRDKLHFLCQQRAFAKRRNWQRQAFLFEVGYYLSHYYLTLWGGLDQLSILLWKSLNLEARRYGVSLGRPDFRRKVGEVGQLFKEQMEDVEFLKWIERLKWRRDTVAHRGTIELTMIYEAGDRSMSDSEIEREVDESDEWKRIRDKVNPELAGAFRATMIHKARLAHYKIQTDEVTVLRDGDESYFTFPLADIDWDYTNYRLAIMNIAELLVSHLET